MKLSLSILLLGFASSISAAPTTSSYVVHEKRDQIHRPRSNGQIRRDAVLPVSIALKQRNLENGYDYLMEVAHPDSPKYGQHWTAERVTSPFTQLDLVIKTDVFTFTWEKECWQVAGCRGFCSKWKRYNGNKVMASREWHWWEQSSSFQGHELDSLRCYNQWGWSTPSHRIQNVQPRGYRQACPRLRRIFHSTSSTGTHRFHQTHVGQHLRCLNPRNSLTSTKANYFINKLTLRCCSIQFDVTAGTKQSLRRSIDDATLSSLGKRDSRITNPVRVKETQDASLQPLTSPLATSTCGTLITPACIRSLYDIPEGTLDL